MKKQLLHIIPLFFYFAFLTPAGALPFNTKLSSEDINTLLQGKVLIRNINHTSNMSLNSINEGAVKLQTILNNLHPDYLAEVIQIRPYTGNEDLPGRLEKLLMNISDYAGIPYFSERTQSYWDLYKSAAVISTEKVNSSLTRINADLDMEPFGVVHTPMEIEHTDRYILYVSTNENSMRYYDKFTCVNPQKMKSTILLFRDGDNWILYGAGGVNALRVPFFDKRIETSFINRIKTFCSYIFEKL
jgi:hypothetical protein